MKVNKSQIARELGKDRRTVEKYLNGYEKPTTRNRDSNLDDYYDLIKELLSDESQQIFYYKRVLWQFLVDNHQLSCAQSSFRRYISKHAEFQEYFESKRKKQTTKKSHMRFETAPGKQAQLDWKESMNFLLKNGEWIEINLFVLLLANSRFRVYRLSLSKSQDILFSFLDNAFELFGGIPEELLTDNMKTVMDQARTEYFKGKVNTRFAQFASDYGFRVRPCIAARPQTKAKVEAPMKLLDEIYAYNGLLDYNELNQLVQKLNDRINQQVHPGTGTKAKVEAPMKLLDEIYAYNGLLDYNELNQLVQKLNDRINQQVHPGTGRIPIMYLQKERADLLPLPKESIRKPYQIITTTVKVNSSSMITYRSNQYSVAPEYIGKHLNLQVYDNHLYAYYSTSLVAIHPISSKKLNYLEQHYVAISELTFKRDHCDIDAIAKNNLNQIGALFTNE